MELNKMNDQEKQNIEKLKNELNNQYKEFEEKIKDIELGISNLIETRKNFILSMKEVKKSIKILDNKTKKLKK